MKLMKEILFIGLLLCCPLLAFTKQCPNLVPGIGRMARGVDITSLDLFPSDLLLSNGFRHSLFNFSCDTDLVWSHPTIPEYHYSLPDQIGAINTVPGGALNMKTSFHQDIESYKDSLNVQVGISISALNETLGGFSASVGYQQANEQILKSNKSVAITAAYVSAVQIDFKSASEMTLNQNVLNYLKALPAKYEDGVEQYNEFIETFGTHYFESAMFGGYLHQKTLIDNDYVFQTNMKDINVNVKGSFLIKGVKIGASVDVGWASNLSKEKFSSNSESSFYYYGGLTDLSDQKDLAYLTRWFNTVTKDPWLFGGQLKPVENLIQNSNIKSQVKKAVLFKKTKAYLDELKSTLYLTGFKLSVGEKRNLTYFEEFIQNPSSGKFKIENIRSTIQQLFVKIQIYRDKANLSDVYNKLATMYSEILGCKNYIFYAYSDCRISQIAHEVFQQIHDYNMIMSKIRNIQSQSSADHNEMQDLIREGSIMIQYQRTTIIDACENNNDCRYCLQNALYYVQYYFSNSCKNMNLWLVLKCKPGQSYCR